MHFPTAIRIRAEALLATPGAVTDLRTTATGLTATVHGTYPYHVQLTPATGEPTD